MEASTQPRDDQIAGTKYGTWSPLKSRIFALLLLINLFTVLAVFMNGLAGAWVLTGITDSPAVVASLQFALALPAFLLALFAGALADVVSRKTLIVVAQSGSMIVAGGFALLSYLDAHTVVTVLSLTVLLGIFTALAAPAWIAVIPGLVPRDEIAGAMTLSSAGTSGAMALGPAIAGFVIAAAGPTAVFVLNVVVLAAGLIALQGWKPVKNTGLPAEHLGSAVRVGIQYLRYDRSLKIVIGKIIPFALAGTALMALLPAVARFELGAGPAMFGFLSGAGGIGAVLALLLMPRVRTRIGSDVIVFISMVVQAGVILVLAAPQSLAFAFVALVIGGAATLAIVSTVMTVLQIVLPSWVRGRGIAVYLFVLQGAFAFGALIWGAVAEQTSLRTALTTAAAVMVVGAFASLPLRLDRLVDIDSTSAQLIDDPAPVTSVHDDDGPIHLTVEWEISPDQRDEFLTAMRPVRTALKRQGALSFRLIEDVEQPGSIVESFSVATWSEYRRLPQRSTMADKDLHDALMTVVGTDLPTIGVRREIHLHGRRSRSPDS